MKFAISGFKHANKDVRDAAYNLILNIYKYIGDNVRNYFKDLRPVQINALDEGFDKLDGLNEELNNNQKGNKNQKAQEEYNNRQTSPNKAQKQGGSGGGGQGNNSDSDDGNFINDK